MRAYFYNLIKLDLKQDTWEQILIKAINQVKGIELTNNQFYKIHCFIMCNNPTRVGAYLHNEDLKEFWKTHKNRHEKSVLIFVGLARLYNKTNYLKFINTVIQDKTTLLKN